MMDVSETSDVSITSDSVDTLINLYVDPSGTEEAHSEAFSTMANLVDARSGAHEGTLSIQDLVGRMEQQVLSATKWSSVICHQSILHSYFHIHFPTSMLFFVCIIDIVVSCL